jgi:hypothetical protein
MKAIKIKIEDPGTAILISEALNLFNISLLTSKNTLEEWLNSEKREEDSLAISEELEGAISAIDKFKKIKESFDKQFEENETIREYLT